MCTFKNIFTHNEVYEAIQVTVTCIQTSLRLWLLKMEDSDNGLFFDMVPKLDIAKYEIKITEYQENSIELKILINQAVVKGLILYCNIDFLPYSSNTSPPNIKFFNLFLGFKAQPAREINPAIIDLILWHAKNIISGGDEELSKYFWHWVGYLV